MSAQGIFEMVRRRHRSLQARIAALEVDGRARRARVVSLAEELVAHATVEQLVLYPYAERLLGVTDLALEIERALESLLAVVGGIDCDEDFAVAIARLGAVFERHVDSDEVGLLPILEAVGDPEHLARMGVAIEEFERAISAAHHEGIGLWPEGVEGVSGRMSRGN
jgi:hypothetical protein